MSQISRYPLSAKVKDQIIDSFWWVLAKLNRYEEVSVFMENFLTSTEKTVLSKRLAIAMMLMRGYSYTQIRSTLKVSTSTIQGLARLLEKQNTGFKTAFRKLSRKEMLENFWKEVSRITKVISRDEREVPT